LVFEAIIGSTSAGSNQSGLFSLVDGEIKLILIEGSLLDITVDAVTEQRIVRSAREIDDLNDNFNNAGVLALYLTFEDGSEGIFTTAVSSLKGDVDLSGVVDFADIPAFIGVLQAGVFQAEADANCDTFVNFADIPAFIAILQGQG
jgi:hypothetical protein